MPSRSIIVVTGATGGIGLGICHRLIDQLCHNYPPDIIDVPSTSDNESCFPCEELTLILPCRSLERGERARKRLLDAARKQLAVLQRSSSYNGHAERFISALSIDLVYCDLASVTSIFEFGRTVHSKYPYITHIINNAGTGSFLGVHVWKGLCEFFKDPVKAVTAPNYKIEKTGEMSRDGLGWVWQCNVFGHFVIYKSLQPLLHKSPFLNSRVLWMSSLEAIKEFYNPVDWQLTTTTTPYEGSKCQMDLLAVTLDVHSPEAKREGDTLIRHLIVQPGVVDTDILGATQIGFVLNYLKLMAFYLARVLFSQNHTIFPYVAAVSAVFASLTPQLPDTRTDTHVLKPVKYSSKTHRNGSPFVSQDTVDVWEGNELSGLNLLKQMTLLYDELNLKDSEKVISNGRDSVTD